MLPDLELQECLSSPSPILPTPWGWRDTHTANTQGELCHARHHTGTQRPSAWREPWGRLEFVVAASVHSFRVRESCSLHIANIFLLQPSWEMWKIYTGRGEEAASWCLLPLGFGAGNLRGVGRIQHKACWVEELALLSV